MLAAPGPRKTGYCYPPDVFARAMEDPAEAATRERRRVARQSKIVLGVGLTCLAGFVLLLAPALTGPLVKDLPYLAVSLLSLFVGGILLGVGYGEKIGRRNR
jgi:hypothetical protein